MRRERDPNYQQFLDTVNGALDGTYDPEEESIATSQEIGWWLQFQTRRAIHHLRSGNITPVESHWLKKIHVVNSTSKNGFK